MMAPATQAVVPSMPSGETLSVPERVIVAPAMGTFHRLDAGDRMLDGHPVDRGDVLGIVRSLGASTPVQSPFQGLLVAMLAVDGQRVRRGQAIAWLRQA
jgi:biotin carboxyl carrier protein